VAVILIIDKYRILNTNFIFPDDVLDIERVVVNTTRSYSVRPEGGGTVITLRKYWPRLCAD
jgi:hypothetical protein